MASYWAVMYTKDAAHKKAKVFEDGVLSLDGRQAQLFDMDGARKGDSTASDGGCSLHEAVPSD
jgi:hypothetical protein